MLILNYLRGDILLRDVDFVAETERHPLALGPDADVAGDGCSLAATEGFLNADVGQSVFAEDRTRVQIGRQKATVT